MDNIYGVLVTMDYPDAITGGLRRTTDMVRGVLERTRSDLTLGMRLKDLENKLQGVKQGDESAVRQDEDIPFEEPVQQDEPVLDESQTIIYEALSKWREHKASEENLSPYVIARNSWLKEIIKLQPSTPKDLMVIKGFGERRANKYGKDIINIIRKSR